MIILQYAVISLHDLSIFFIYITFSIHRADCSLLNDWCCPLYAGHNTEAVKDGKRRYVFQTGDKICPTRNANVTDYLGKGDMDNSIAAASTSFQLNDVAMQNMQSNMAASSSQQQDPPDAHTSESSLQQNNTATQEVNSSENKAATQHDVDEAAEIAFLEQLCSQHPVSPYPGQGMQVDGSYRASGTGDDDEKKKEKTDEKRICNGEIYFIENVSV